MQKNVIFLTKIIVYVKTLVKIFFSKFLLEAFIVKRLLFAQLSCIQPS